jgi:flavin reductase (DIM6/NTAB) family NADH-FMN oxidoreductase RutF
LPVSAEQFRSVLAHWASGVTVVTAADGERVHGMTVSAFTSVSLTPPLVLVCADKSSNTLELIEAGGCFAANILASDQRDLSNRFASKKEEHRRFEGIPWERGTTGAPILAGVHAHIDCRVVARHDAGDHVIYVGSVESARLGEGAPLLYYRGGYHDLAADPT